MAGMLVSALQFAFAAYKTRRAVWLGEGGDGDGHENDENGENDENDENDENGENGENDENDDGYKNGYKDVMRMVMVIWMVIRIGRMVRWMVMEKMRLTMISL